MTQAPNASHDAEVEMQFAGGLLAYPDSYHDIAHLITAEAFENKTARIVFEAVKDLIDDEGTFDLVSVAERTFTRGVSLDTLSTMSESAAWSFPPHHMPRHANLLKDLAQRRALVGVATQIAALVNSDRDRSATEVTAEAERLITEVMLSHSVSRSVSAAEAVKITMDLLDQRAAAPVNNPFSIETPFCDLNKLLSGGLWPGDLIVIAGRPSMGKSALAARIVDHCVGSGRPVGYESLEMTTDQLNQRFLSARANVPASLIRSGRLHEEHWPLLSRAAREMMAMPLFINDDSTRSVDSLVSNARLLRRRHGIRLLVVDYLQLISFGGGSNDNRAQQIGDATRRFKRLAKELDIPVVLLSQVNRDCEKRPNKRPIMADLRESGSIEQDADVVMFLYREEVYDAKSGYAGTAELNVAKQRAGATGMVRLAYDAPHTLFSDYIPTRDGPEGAYVN